MDTLTQLQQNRRIIEEFTSSALAKTANPFSRLACVSSFRDLSSNAYEHAGLSAIYPREAVRQALEQCHHEIFERILETPLAVQEQDLRAYLQALPKGLPDTAALWRKLEAYRSWLPADAPEYLRELFCSNIRSILEILENEVEASPQ